MFHLFDTYSAGISLLCSALFEAIAVSWFYGKASFIYKVTSNLGSSILIWVKIAIIGLERFTGDVELMLGHRPGLYWRICWKFISPSFIIVSNESSFCLEIQVPAFCTNSNQYNDTRLQGVVVFGLLYHEPLQYNDYLYPTWAEWMGWGLALSSILMIPLFMILQLLSAPGTLKEVNDSELLGTRLAYSNAVRY